MKHNKLVWGAFFSGVLFITSCMSLFQDLDPSEMSGAEDDLTFELIDVEFTEDAFTIVADKDGGRLK